MNWERYIKDFVAYLKVEKGLSAHTILAYESDTAKLANYCLDQNLEPQNVRRSHVDSFLTTLYDLGLSARTQARIITGIKQFFVYMFLEEIISENPVEDLEQPKLGRKLPEVLSVEEVDRLIASVDVSKTEGHRNRAIMETLYSCGLRVSELISLKYSDLYPEEGFIRIVGKGNKQRLVPLSSAVLEQIKRYEESMRDHLTPKKGHENTVFLNRRGAGLTRVMIFTIIRQAAASARVDKTVSPHTFRHCFATHLLEGGANLRAIQEMLGHESITTTEIYTHLDQKQLRETVMQFHPRNNS